jgi:hypothetical protein
MFSTIFTSVALVTLVVYTSFAVSTYFADRTNKKIDDMCDRINNLENKEP